jgi:hypothetical protein
MPRFDEYTFFTENTYHLSERRQTSTQTFLTINTAIFTILAFLAKDAGFRGWPLVLVSVPLFVVGLLVCIIWSRMLAQFTALIRWRYEQLRAMEQTLPESHQMMTQEWEHFFKPNQRNERFGFSRLEARLPQMFLFLYAVYGVGLVLATAAGWR